MKLIRILSIVVLAFGIICTGCATNTGTPLTPEQQEFNNIRRVQSGVRLAVFLGVSFDLKAHPERKDAYLKSQAALAVLIAEQKWDALAFSSALSESGSKLFSSGDASLVLSTVPLLIDVLSGSAIDLSQPKFVRPAMTGALEGLQMALQ